MKKTVLTMMAVSAFAVAGAATPLWLRDVKISPNGEEIAFCYKGDIYKVAATGGSAVQLTTQEAYDCSPVWSPDGSKIAFASDRNGNMDVYVMSSTGGKAKRLTTNSAGEIPTTFTPDGKSVLFNAAIQDPAESAMFPTSAMNELYAVSVSGGATTQVLGTPAEMVNYDKSGKFFLYQDKKGFEDEWRKHHTSSITRDVWRYDVNTGKHENLTDRAGEDRNPILAGDGNTVYFLSERNGGSFNVYSFSLDNPKQVKSVTSFKTHPVRFLSVSNKDMLCYAYDGEIYTQLPGKSPVKVKIDIVRDDENNPVIMKKTSGAYGSVVSPDGKQVAFIIRGEVFVTSVEYNTTKRITNTAAGERGITWHPENRKIAYASEREGNWQLYTAEIVRKEDLNFPNATVIKEEILLPNDKVERTYPTYSPDGKELAFIEDRNKLMVYNFETKKTRQVTDGTYWYRTDGGFHYTWSPDGKWFALEIIGNGHDPYSDVAIVSAQGGEVTNITGSGYFSVSPRWTQDGNALVFATDRYGMRSHASWGSLMDVMMVFMNQDAYDKYMLSKEDYELQKELEKQQKKDKEEKEKKDKKEDKKGDKKDDKKKDGKKKDEKKDIVVELDGISDRIVRLTRNSSDIYDAIVDGEGENLYYTRSGDKGIEVMKIDLRKREESRVGSTKATSFGADKTGKTLFLLGRGMSKMGAGGKMTPITYSAEVKMNLADERAYMFDHVWKQEKKRFYQENMHGVKWDMMYKAYSKFLPHIDNNYDFAEMLSEILGELNVSHTGGRYYAPGGGESTADLGLLYDWHHKGKGLKVAEVIEKGPFDHKNTKLTVGCVIEKINGEEITENTDFALLLNGIVKKKTLVSLFNPADGSRWEEVVLPITKGALNSLLYQRWVKQREADVERWSNGRLGYVHIQSMNDGSFRNIYSDILGKFNKKEGIVIDTRFNGGGRLHEDVEILFSGKKYFTQVVRGREACDMPSRRWNKPSIMVQCEANYSNAHGTPYVYKFGNLGKLVGMPVPGTMTSVSWETLQDPSLVFGIPVVGYRVDDGSYLENKQLEPDIKVANSPETIVKGEDTQLRVAVEELLKDLDKK